MNRREAKGWGDVKLKHSFYNESELIMVFYGTMEDSLDISDKLDELAIEYTHCETEAITKAG